MRLITVASIVLPLLAPLQVTHAQAAIKWTLGSSNPTAYTIASDGSPMTEPGATLSLKSTNSLPNGFGALSTLIPPDTFAGHRVRISADIETKDVSVSASLWVKADSAGTALAFDNGANQVIKGTTTGARHMEITVYVPTNATTLIFGLLLSGTGEATARNVRIVARPALPGDAGPRSLGPVVATWTATTPFSQVVPLRTGAVFANDVANRRLILLDSTLSRPTVVLDSARTVGNAYGAAIGVLLPFRGDSVLFNDRSSNSFLVIDGGGKIARVMAAAPNPPATVGTMVVSGFSDRLGLIYVGTMAAAFRFPTTLAPASGEPDKVWRYEDTMFVIASDIETRRQDTLAKLASGYVVTRTLRPFDSEGTKASSTMLPALYAFRDDLAMMRDGSLAIVRARERRLEWITPGRTPPPTVRLPYDWHRITDDERVQLLDGMNSWQKKTYDSTLTKWLSDSAAGRIALRRTQIFVSPTGERIPREVAVTRPVAPPMVVASEIPDFQPPVPASPKGDADGLLWIQHVGPAPGMNRGAYYQLVDRTGVVVDEVKLAVGRSVVGFSPGFVYLSATVNGKPALEKVRIK